MNSSNELFITSLASGLTGAISGILGGIVVAWYTLWLQERKEKVKLIDTETLSVHFSAIKRDEKGHYIPGHGRINWGVDSDTGAVLNLDEHPYVQEWGKKIAFICDDRTPGSSDVKHYIISGVVPL